MNICLKISGILCVLCYGSGLESVENGLENGVSCVCVSLKITLSYLQFPNNHRDFALENSPNQLLGVIIRWFPILWSKII